MPLFFFHLRTPEGLDLGDEGLSFPDLDTAYLNACEAIPAMTAEFMARGSNPLAYSFVIADEAGQALLEVPFDECLRGRRSARTRQHDRFRRLSQEIADMIETARATMRQSHGLFTRSRAQ